MMMGGKLEWQGFGGKGEEKNWVIKQYSEGYAQKDISKMFTKNSIKKKRTAEKTN